MKTKKNINKMWLGWSLIPVITAILILVTRSITSDKPTIIILSLAFIISTMWLMIILATILEQKAKEIKNHEN